MSCDIAATENGQPCCQATLERIRQHVASIEESRGPMRACRVDIEGRRNDRAIGGNVFVTLSLLPEFGLSVCKRIAYAMQDNVPAALDTAFRSASVKLRETLSSACSRPESGHVVRLLPDGRNGTIAMDDGSSVDFHIAAWSRSVFEPLQMGDRVWLTPAARDGLPGELIFARRSGPVLLQLLGDGAQQAGRQQTEASRRAS